MCVKYTQKHVNIYGRYTENRLNVRKIVLFPKYFYVHLHIHLLHELDIHVVRPNRMSNLE